jgi:hypothetical protein
VDLVRGHMKVPTSPTMHSARRKDNDFRPGASSSSIGVSQLMHLVKDIKVSFEMNILLQYTLKVINYFSKVAIVCRLVFCTRILRPTGDRQTSTSGTSRNIQSSDVFVRHFALALI